MTATASFAMSVVSSVLGPSLSTHVRGSESLLGKGWRYFCAECQFDSHIVCSKEDHKHSNKGYKSVADCIKAKKCTYMFTSDQNWAAQSLYYHTPIYLPLTLLFLSFKWAFVS